MGVLVAFLLGILASASGHKQKRATQDSERANRCDGTPSPPTQITFGPEVMGDFRREQEHQAIQNSLKRATWCTFWAVLIYAAMTLGIFRAAKKSADAAQEAAIEAKNSRESAERSARLDQRAWVAVSEITPSAETKSPWWISIVFKNTGRTPAKNFTIQLAGEPVTKGVKPSAAEMMAPGRGVIPPDGVFHFDLSTKKPYDWRAFDVVVHGKIVYDSVFGKTHWTSFCYYFVPGSTARTKSGFAPCETGNDVDDSEP